MRFKSRSRVCVCVCIFLCETKRFETNDSTSANTSRITWINQTVLNTIARAPHKHKSPLAILARRTDYVAGVVIFVSPPVSYVFCERQTATECTGWFCCCCSSSFFCVWFVRMFFVSLWCSSLLVLKAFSCNLFECMRVCYDVFEVFSRSLVCRPLQKSKLEEERKSMRNCKVTRLRVENRSFETFSIGVIVVIDGSKQPIWHMDLSSY